MERFTGSPTTVHFGGSAEAAETDSAIGLASLQHDMLWLNGTMYNLLQSLMLNQQANSEQQGLAT